MLYGFKSRGASAFFVFYKDSTMFKPGESGNPNGRPKGSRNLFNFSEFQKALQEVEKEKGKSLYRHAIEQAYVNEKVLVALLNKIMPQVEVSAEEDEEFLSREIGFLDVPDNGEGEARFREYVTPN